MLTTKELLDNAEFQVTIHFVYYDYGKEERIEITEKQAEDKEIRYIYCENDEIYIEIDMEN